MRRSVGRDRPAARRVREEERMRRGDDLEPEDRKRDFEGRGPMAPPPAGIKPRHVVITLFAIVLLAFAIVNFDYVDVSFLVFETRARLVTVIAVAAALGFVIGYFTGRPGRLQRRWLRRREEDLRKREDELED
jgi:uncharacterized integral membrane protein